MEQINFFHKGISSGLDNSKVQSDSWVFPSLNVRVLNKRNQGLIVSRMDGVQKKTSISKNFKFIGSAHMDGILYLVSCNKATAETEIGCYPSPKSYTVNNGLIDINYEKGFEDAYKPLANFTTDVLSKSDAQRMILRTTLFNYSMDNPVQILPVVSYDRSVDLIIIDGLNPNRIINTGFDYDGILTQRLIYAEYFKGSIDQVKTTDKYPYSKLYSASTLYDDNFIAQCLYNTTYSQIMARSGVIHLGLPVNERIPMNNEVNNSDNYIIEGDYGYYNIPFNGNFSFNAAIYLILQARMRIPGSGEIISVNGSINVKVNLVRNRQSELTVISTGNKWVNLNTTNAIEFQIIINGADHMYEQGDKVFLELGVDPVYLKLFNDSVAYFDLTLLAKSSFSYNIYQESEIPVRITDGGKLLPGNYFLFIRYLTSDFNKTQFVGNIGPIAIYENDKLGNIEGAKHDQSTTKQLIVTIENLDTAYSFYEVGVLRYFGEMGYMLNDAYLISNLFETNNSTITITGNEDQELLTLSELVDSASIEKTCKAQTIIDNVYYGGNWRSIDVNNKDLSDLAKKVTLRYNYGDKLRDTTINELESWYPNSSAMDDFYGYKNIVNQVNNVGYHRGQVVPFAIRFILTDQTKTTAFPVTGYDCYDGTYKHPNTKGIFRFPFFNDNQTDLVNDLSVPIGISFDLSQLYEHLNANPDKYKNVQTIMLVRAEEIETKLYQGVAVPMMGGNVKRYPNDQEDTSMHMPMFNQWFPVMYFPNDQWADGIYMDSWKMRHFLDLNPMPPETKYNKRLIGLFTPDILLSKNHKIVNGRKYYMQVIAKHKAKDPGDIILEKNDKIIPGRYAYDIQQMIVNPRPVELVETMIVEKDSNANFGSNKLLTKAYPGDFYHHIVDADGNDLHFYNRMMATPGYIAMMLNKDIDDNVDDVSYMINIYINDPTTANFFESIVSNFIASNCKYSIIANYIEVNPQITKYTCYRGNAYNTRMYFRAMHWEQIPDTSEPVGDAWEDIPAYYYAHGLLLGMKVESNVNAAMRHGDNTYTYYPKLRLQDIIFENKTIKGNAYQFIINDSDFYIYEAFYYNTGYQKSISDDVTYGYNDKIPLYRREYPTRIRLSSRNNSNAFVSGFSSFSANNFVDFDFQGGPINGLFSVNGILVSVQDKRINQHYINQKEVNTDSATGMLTMGIGQLLADTTNPLAEFGSQHRFGMAQIGDIVYGVDVLGMRIFAIGSEVSTFGKAIPRVEDITKNNMLSDELKDIFLSLDINHDKIDPFKDNPLKQGISIGYDPDNGEVIFCFINSMKRRSLVYSDNLQAFTCSTSLISGLYQHIGSKLYSLKEDDIFEHNIGVKDYEGKVMELKISAICNGLNPEQNTSIYKKNFLAQVIETPFIELDKISYETETQLALRDPFSSNGKQFWKDPEYHTMAWHVPMVEARVASGQFEQGSELTGGWLKTTLSYWKEAEIYIKSIRTIFNLKIE